MAKRDTLAAGPGLPALTVIIPVRNDERVLRSLAAVMEGCSLPAGAVEYMVVVSASSAEFEALVRARVPEGVRVLAEERRGVSAARNAGVRAARSGLLAFTDADAVARPGWAEAALDGFAATGADALRGLAGSIGDAFAQRMIQSFTFRRGRGLEPGDTVRIDGKNFAARRAVLEQIPFNEASLRGEDIEWNILAEAAGLKVAFWPAMQVDHEHLTELDYALAKRICDVFVIRRMRVSRPEIARKRGATRRGRLIALMARAPGSRVMARFGARMVLRSGALFQRVGPRLPERLALAIMSGLREGSEVAAWLMVYSGERQPGVERLLRRSRSWWP